jgi:splicing factor 3A subunit 3
MLLDYLFDFTKRTMPLLDLSEELNEAQQDFESKFAGGEFPGWPKETGGALAHTGAHLDLVSISRIGVLTGTFPGKSVS